MPDYAWGLQMMVVGMGVVFGLLLALMGLLLLIGRLDRPDAAASGPRVDGAWSDAGPDAVGTGVPGSDATGSDAAGAARASGAARAAGVRIIADGLDETQVAAIAIAVMTHAEIRRRSAAPEVRASAPGSQLFASRWVAIGRGQQQAPYHRR